MSKNSEQKNDVTEQGQELPYVSKFSAEMIKGMEGLDLKTRVLIKAFVVIFVGLLISAVTSYVSLPYFDTLYTWLPIFMCAQFLFMFACGWVIGRDHLVFAVILYPAYSVNTGITFSLLFQAFGLDIMKEAFLIAAVTFGMMAVVGYFTKKDLGTVGGVLGTALLGSLAVMLFNFLVFHRSEFELFMEYVVVLLFVGIIANDMSRLRKAVSEGGEENETRIALFMGMQLYIDFMNVYIFVTSLLGKLLRNVRDNN